MLLQIWYGLLVLMQVVSGDISLSGNFFDIYIDSAHYATLSVRGNYRTGAMYDGSELFGEYEAASRYRQVYLVYPFADFQIGESDFESGARPVSETREGENMAEETNGTVGPGALSMATGAEIQELRFAAGRLKPFAIDFTPAFSARRRLTAGESMVVEGIGYPFDRGSTDFGDVKASGVSPGATIPAGSSGVVAGWVVRREANRLSAVNSALGLVVVLVL